MAVWYSSDLGWLPGSDVSSEFSLFLSDRFSSGDTLVLEDTYRLSGSNLRVPEGVTLTAVKGGGFDVVTSGRDSSPLLVLSDDVTVDNITFTAVAAPNTGYSGANPQVGTDYHAKRVLRVDGDRVTVENSAFAGNVAMHMDVEGGNDLTIRDSLFEGGFYQVRLNGSTDDARILGSHFRKALGDGIKTESIDGQGPQRTLVRDSLFDDNARDGIDVAGGFRDGRVENVVFHDNGVSGIDIKSGYDDLSDLDPRKANTGIRVTDSQFIDSPNGVVVTVINRQGVLTEQNQQNMPHDIRVTDSVFENTKTGSGDIRAFLIKDGYDITWDGLILRGNVVEMRFLDAETPGTLSGTNVRGRVARREGSNATPAGSHSILRVGYCGETRGRFTRQRSSFLFDPPERARVGAAR